MAGDGPFLGPTGGIRRRRDEMVGEMLWMMGIYTGLWCL